MDAPAPRTFAFAVEGPVGRDDLPGLCERVCALLEQHGSAIALCDVGGVQADAVTVDALARLQLAARRYGCRIHLRGASKELRELVGFMALSDVLPTDATSRDAAAARRAGTAFRYRGRR